MKTIEREYQSILFITLFFSLFCTLVFTYLDSTKDINFQPEYWLYLIVSVSTYFLTGLFFIHTKDKTRRTKELPTIPVRKGRLTNPKIKNAEISTDLFQTVYNPHTGTSTKRVNSIHSN